MFLICDNGIAIGICEKYEQDENGNITNVDAQVSYGFIPTIYEIEKEDIPADFVPFKYHFNEEEGFVKDENFLERDPLFVEHQLELAFERINELENALCELSEEIV